MSNRKSSTAAFAARHRHTVLAASLLFALSARAQEAASDKSEAKKEKETTELTTVVVTGTRKAGLSPTESISPIDVYSGVEIEQQAAAALTDSLTKITPAFNTQQ